MTPELFLSRDGELRDIQEKFSEYVRYMLRSLVQNFIFQSLSMSLLLNLLFEPDPYSNEYSMANVGYITLSIIFDKCISAPVFAIVLLFPQSLDRLRPTLLEELAGAGPLGADPGAYSP